MKHVNKLLALCICMVLLLPAKTKASHTAGGELVYQWISDSTYRFIFKYYRDCSGIPEPTTFTLCLAPTPASGTCPGLSSFQVTMTKYPGTITGGKPNGTNLATGCTGTVTKCSSSTSLIPDYREWWYSALATLPGRCNFWTFSVDAGTRNAQNNVATSGSMHIDATLNNVLFQGNTSPSFAIGPMVYVPNNNPFQYNNAAIDVDGDSLSTDVVMPRNTNSACPPTASPTGLTTGLSIPGGPFPSSAFNLTALTGTMSFVATTLGTYALAIQVSEYRSGTLIGHITREMQFNVLNYTPSAVAATLDLSTLTNCTYNSGVIYNPSNLAMSFCFYIKASVASTILLIAGDNSSYVFTPPPATVTYTHQGTDSVRGCFSWSPPSTASGTRIFTVLIKDSTCAAGLASYHAYSWPVSLDSPVSVKNIPAANTGTVVYPNPAQNVLTIKTNTEYTTAYVTNSVGQLLLQQKINAADKKVNISSLPPGLYYIKLEGKKGETETLKFSKE